MKRVATLIVLLVGDWLMDYAHALPPHLTGKWNTTASTGYNQLNGPRKLNESAVLGKSVVENWQTVCEVVCRTGYGGPGCGAQCATKATKVISTNDNFHTFCSILCLNGLGQSKCSCPQLLSKSINNIKHHQDLLCHSYCRQTKLTLSGCSPCQSIENSSLFFFTGTTDKQELIASSTAAPPTTPTTTPDWNELCQTLCKSGDGGALCDCDLPPLDF